jgi:hypothetical protein
VNTGTNGGVIRLVEKYLGRPMQWMVCQLHTICSSRSVLVDITGPHCFSGIRGNWLDSCEKLPTVDFVLIETILPGLSTKKAYLVDVCRAVSSGHCPLNVSKKVKVAFRT